MIPENTKKKACHAQHRKEHNDHEKSPARQVMHFAPPDIRYTFPRTEFMQCGNLVPVLKTLLRDRHIAPPVPVEYIKGILRLHQMRKRLPPVIAAGAVRKHHTGTRLRQRDLPHTTLPVPDGGRPDLTFECTLRIAQEDPGSDQCRNAHAKQGRLPAQASCRQIDAGEHDKHCEKTPDQNEADPLPHSDRPAGHDPKCPPLEPHPSHLVKRVCKAQSLFR